MASVVQLESRNDVTGKSRYPLSPGGPFSLPYKHTLPCVHTLPRVSTQSRNVLFFAM
jgi:hypothetical protein